MSTVWIHYARARTRWYETEPSIRAANSTAWEMVDQRSFESGGELNGVFHVRGQSDWTTVEIWSFPTPETAFDHWARKVDAGYAQWFAFSNNLGTSIEADAQP